VKERLASTGLRTSVFTQNPIYVSERSFLETA